MVFFFSVVDMSVTFRVAGREKEGGYEWIADEKIIQIKREKSE